MNTFNPLPGTSLEARTFGEHNSAVTIIRLPNGPDDWQEIPGTRVLLIGGVRAKQELRHALTHVLSRADLNKAAAISGRTHQRMRRWLSVPDQRRRSQR